VVPLSFHQLLERPNRILDLDISPGGAGEFLGHEERLGKEALNLPGPGDDELVFFREFVHSQDGDDVLEVLVLLKDELDPAGDGVMLLSDDQRIQDSGGRIQGVHGRIDAQLDDLPGKNGRGIQVGKGRLPEPGRSGRQRGRK